MTAKNTWVTVAGCRTRIMEDDPRSWRCFIGSEKSEIPIRAFVLEGGQASPNNCAQGVLKEGDDRGIFAWIDFYATSVRIEDEILYLVLGEPA